MTKKGKHGLGDILQGVDKEVSDIDFSANPKKKGTTYKLKYKLDYQY